MWKIENTKCKVKNVVGMLIMISFVFMGCSKVEELAKMQVDKLAENIDQDVVKQIKEQVTDGFSEDLSQERLSGLPSNFPVELPIFNGAIIMEADNFNGNMFTILYQVEEDYQKIADFYMNQMNLDPNLFDEEFAYIEAIDYEDLYIKGLTIEKSDNNVNVFITFEDTRIDNSAVKNDWSDDENYDDDYSYDSDIITYDNAEIVMLDDNYPDDVVPIYKIAKVIGVSMVPNSRSGFIDLIAPADKFQECVEFYENALFLNAEESSTVIQQAAIIKGRVDNIDVVIYITKILADGNDTYIQITLNEQ